MARVRRRACAALAGIAVVTCATAIAPLACGSSSSAPFANPDASVNLDDWNRPITRPTDDVANAARAQCKYARGALAGETHGTSTPVDQDIPIETIVVLMQENRSFDHYFGHLYKYAGRTDIESARDDTTNPDRVDPASPGGSHPYQHAPHLCNLDTDHEWPGTHLEFDNGKMDGFFEANENWAARPPNAPPSASSGERALWWFDERDLPFYYDLAATFAIGDHHHSALLGPTWPNRMFLYAATSFGVTDQNFPDISAYPYPKRDATIFDMLEKRGVSWMIYGDGLPGATVTVPLVGSRWGRNPLLHITDFFAQAAAGTLPQVVFVDPKLGRQQPNQDDEHPPADVQVGQEFVSRVVHALFVSPQWSKLALFITYDEHGGYFDHVPPPVACVPDAIDPIVQPADVTKFTNGAGFDRYGIRVPLIVVSPFAKKKFVSHVTRDHTSITRFIEAKFRVPALTARDANADAMLEYFDFQNPPFLAPPKLAPAVVDPTELDYCIKTFTP